VRIAVVADDLYPGFGGQAAATESHIEILAARGHALRALAGAERKPTAPPLGVALERVPAWQPGQTQTNFALPDPRRINWVLEDAQVVQINTPTPLGLLTLLMARAKGIPCVMGFHTQEESATTHFRGLAARVIGGLLRGWYRFFYSSGDALSVPTPFAARLAARYTSGVRAVVSNGVRFAALRALGDALEPEERESWLEGKRYLISYVGRLAPEKRPEGLLEIMAGLKTLRSDARLLIAGRGPLHATLEAHVKELGLEDSVRLLGFVSEADKARLLRASDVFIMPSPTELQSIATIEAMAQGAAVMAAKIDSSAVGEMVEQAECGITYDLDSPAAAARDLNALLEDPARLEGYRRNARACAQTHDLAHSAEALEVLYASLVSERQQPRPSYQKQ
jgi:glycosyltransferase involved in cell wall biosynthesis